MKEIIEKLEKLRDKTLWAIVTRSEVASEIHDIISCLQSQQEADRYALKVVIPEPIEDCGRIWCSNLCPCWRLDKVGNVTYCSENLSILAWDDINARPGPKCPRYQAKEGGK